MIFDHQRTAFEKLLSIAKACFHMQRQTLPLHPRTNSLIIGPSGTGKTHLARAVAEELNVAFIHLTANEWIPLGCSENRGASTTWPMLFAFLKANHKAEGVIIFVDELDKLQPSSSWDGYLRTEIFNLLDFQIPTGLRPNDDDDELDKVSLQRAQRTLTNQTLILGGGAFQHIWDQRSKTTVGFGEQQNSVQETDLTHLVATLPRELVNRFRSELIILPQLKARDYRRMIEMVENRVPSYLKATFNRLASERIANAVHCQLGCRFAEEVLLDTIIQERTVLQSHGTDKAGSPKQTETVEQVP